MPTYLSGIQPTGLPHLGNYFGAIQHHVALQKKGGEHFYFIADYHALTTSRAAETLRESVREIAVTYLAFGLDPERAVFFRQSDVPEVCELTWLLGCVIGMGLLERAHSYKDKTARGIAASAGLFFYPVLMAADILAYDSDFVPVGQDQVQHIEMAQDMAQAFNARYGEVFKRPEPLLSEHTKVPGLDGQKMSKSYQNDLWVFESGKALAKAIGRITTDSRPPSEPKDPSSILLFDFLRLFLAPQELEQWRERIQRGGPEAPGYGHMKARLIEAIEAAFATARGRRERLLANPGEVEVVLQQGAARARERARATRDRAIVACGLR